MSWQSELFDQLRDREWHQVGELFEVYERAIPLHFATRRYVLANQTTKLPEMFDARWGMFRAVLSRIGVDRDHEGVALHWNTRIRLKYLAGRLCGECGGPMIKASWSGAGGCCLACTAPRQATERDDRLPPIVVIDNPTPPPPSPIPTPQPTLRLVPSSPPEQAPKTFADLALLSSLDDMWDEFAWQVKTFSEFKKNKKLRWALHQALESGAADEYKRMSLFKMDELRFLQFPTLAVMGRVLQWRAQDWVEQKTPRLTKDERLLWAEFLIDAFRFGSLAVVSITIADRLDAIDNEMVDLVSKLEPRQRPRAPPKQRWRPAFRNTMRWRVH